MVSNTIRCCYVQGNIYVKNKKYGQVVDEKFSLQGESIEYKTQYTSPLGEVSNPLAPSSPQVTVPFSQDVNSAQSNHDQPHTMEIGVRGYWGSVGGSVCGR